MADRSELLRVPAFEGLPEDQIDWFLSQSQELHYKAGDTYLRQGTPADSMFVILEGQLEIHGELSGETVTFSMKAGDVTGVLPFSRMTQFKVNGRAVPTAASCDFLPHCFRILCRRCRNWPSVSWASCLTASVKPPVSSSSATG